MNEASSSTLIEISDPFQIQRLLIALYEHIESTLPDLIFEDLSLILATSLDIVYGREAELKLANKMGGLEAYNLRVKAAQLPVNIQKVGLAWNRILQNLKRGVLDPTLDPHLQWLANHPEEVASFRGMTVAVHLTKGIVAAGSNLEVVMDQLKAQGLLEDPNICIESLDNPP